MSEAYEAATHILVEAGVRYWEDATVNGVEDENGTLIPGRDGDLWRVKIDLAAGKIEDWPAGTTASIHYKVCDAGEYWLTDAAGRKLARHEGYYVPDAFLCHGDRGFSDYIIMHVRSDGSIADYQRPSIDSDWVPDASLGS